MQFKIGQQMVMRHTIKIFKYHHPNVICNDLSPVNLWDNPVKTI